MRLAERLLQKLPPEMAHNLTIKALGSDLLKWPLPLKGHPNSLFGREMMSRIGLAAGADKNGMAIDGWQVLGFGFAEIGTVTTDVRYGNPGTRVWRIGDSSMVNWMGLPNDGFLRVLDNIRNSGHDQMALGLSIASTLDSKIELQWMAAAAASSVDYIAYNASCPNIGHSTGVGGLSHIELDELVSIIVKAAEPTPVLVKLAPEPDKRLLELASNRLLNVGVKGFIACNTVKYDQRVLLGPMAPRDWPRHLDVPVGGYSGPGLYPIAKRMIEILRANHGDIILIGCGGIQTAEALEGMLSAGADAVQIYTGLARHGTDLLRDLLEADAKIHERGEREVIIGFDKTPNALAST